MERRSVDESETQTPVPDVTLAQLVNGERMNVQHYRFEPGAIVPRHRHEHEQAGFLYQGTLTFLLEDGREIVTTAGDGYVLPSDMSHQVENRGEKPAVGVDIFSPPRPAPAWETE